METLFGVPIGTLTAVLSVIFLIGAALFAVLALRNRVMFTVALRNIPRRRAQSLLIVVGLMLATVLFSASFGTGDTLAHSIRALALERIGMVDVLVFPGSSQAEGEYISDGTLAEVEAALEGQRVAGIMGVVQSPAAALSPSNSRSEPRVSVLGVDPSRMAGFDALLTAEGDALDVAALAEGDVYISTAVADGLDAEVGDRLHFFFSAIPTAVSVAGVYESGANPAGEESAVMVQDPLRRYLEHEGGYDYIAISAEGSLTGSAEETDAIVGALQSLVDADILRVEELKSDALEAADAVGGSLAAIFLIFGQFSIMAGILLIFLIFVMLAAERRRELGIMRAIGGQRAHVVRLFTFEGAAYSITAAAVGSVLGVAVGVVLTRAIGRVLSGFDIDITFAFRWQSLVLAFVLGMVTTFIVVLLAAGRTSALNIVRAVRDIPDPPGERPDFGGALREPYRRFFSGLGALARLRISGLRTATLGVSGAVFRAVWLSFGAGWGALVFGVLLILIGYGGKQLSTVMLGVSLALIGIPLILRHNFRLPDRPAYTSAGLLLVAWWLLPFDVVEQAFEGFNQGIEIFFLSGIMLVLGGVWTVMYNSDLIMRALLALFGRSRMLAPILRTSIAYPMAARFRTGMTLAMFAIIVFTLIVVGFITNAFSAAFDDYRRFSGGYDVSATVNFINPIDDIEAEIAANPNLSSIGFETVGSTSGLPVRVRQVQPAAQAEEADWFITGVDSQYALSNRYEIQARAPGYATDEDVWRAVAEGDDVIVVSPLLVPRREQFGPGGPMPDFQFEGFYAEDETLPDVFIEVRHFSGDDSVRLKVIGVLDDQALFVPTMITGHDHLLALEPDVPFLNYVFRLPNPALAESEAAAEALEVAFTQNGLQAVSLEREVAEATGVNIAFNRLLQAFMGLGLVVGIAALGVIAARSVVERRQQIGVLRAVGFQRGMVQLSFLLEASYIALLGIAIGLGLGVALSVSIVHEIGTTFEGVRFVVPWATIAVVVVVAYGASMLTTFLPARQAANVYPAEALRIAE